MYYQVISQCVQSLKNLEVCLDKAKQYADAKKFDVSVLMTSRLAPDMQPHIYQVQSACDYVKAAAAWLSGQTPPKRTIDELRARIRKTVAFAESLNEAQYAGASERKVKFSWAPGKVIGGEDYLLQTNTFFHIAMAYAILRHNGVDVGKMDFLGPIKFVATERSRVTSRLAEFGGRGMSFKICRGTHKWISRIEKRDPDPRPLARRVKRIGASLPLALSQPGIAVR
jgi:hypothetical protein